MFAGITQGVYPVVVIDKTTDLLIYSVALPDKLLSGLGVGDSVAIDGVCQTVTKITGNDVFFQAIAETLKKTTLASLTTSRLVSVERSLCIGDEIGGHEVTGHVFDTGTIAQMMFAHDNLTCVIHCDPTWMQYVFAKGYVAVDGSSLTVGEIDIAQGLFTLYLIPETQRVTNFANKQIGDKVNLEFDAKTVTIVETMQRYLERQK